MKWNKYPETIPEKSGFYVVRFVDKVRGYQYGCRYITLKDGVKNEFDKGYGDTTITHWGEVEEFRESAKMMKRPSDEKLVRQYLDEYTGKGLAEIFVDLFSDEEMKEILIEKMSKSDFRAIAEDSWDDACFVSDCEREDRLWRSGYYS